MSAQRAPSAGANREPPKRVRWLGLAPVPLNVRWMKVLPPCGRFRWESQPFVHCCRWRVAFFR